MKIASIIGAAVLVMGLGAVQTEARTIVVKKRPRPRVVAKARVVAPAPVKVVKVRTRPVVVARPRIVVRSSTVVPVIVGNATIDFDVDPEESRIYVDGTYRGEADDLDGFPSVLHLAAGTHRVRIETPDGTSVAQRVTLSPGSHITLDLDLD